MAAVISATAVAMAAARALVRRWRWASEKEPCVESSPFLGLLLACSLNVRGRAPRLSLVVHDRMVALKVHIVLGISICSAAPAH
eukprot:3152462-Pyramimonas_sp.AAC.1